MSAGALLAGLLAGCAVLLTAVPGPAVLRLRGCFPTERAHLGAATGRRWAVPTALPPLVVSAAAAVVVGPAAGLLAGVLSGVLARRAATARAAAADTDERTAAVAACSVLAAELRAGRHPGRALREAAGFGVGSTADWLAAAAAAETVGGDPAEVLGSATGPAAAELQQLGACWAVSARTGAGLVTAVDRLAAGLRARSELDAEVQGALTAPRATARLLAVLPLLGIALGLLLGAAPVAFLTTTPVGLACLGAGLALDLAGLAVTDRLVGRAARRAGVAL